MTTGYRDGTTTPDVRIAALEQRVAQLERQQERRDRQTADRRMWLSYYGFSAFMAIGIAVIVYLAASLD